MSNVQLYLLFVIYHLVDPYYKIVKEFTQENLKSYPFPFGQMAREVLRESPGSDAIID